MTQERSQEPKPVFYVNPEVLVVMNDSMASCLLEFFDTLLEDRVSFPQQVFAFRNALKRDFENAGTAFRVPDDEVSIRRR